MTRQFLTFILFGASAFAQAQVNTYSPYSIYGLGDATYSSMASMAGVSHTGIAMLNTQQVNTINPAAISVISNATANIDLKNEFLVLSNAGSTQGSSILSIDNLSFAFPIINNNKRKRRAGLAFGVTPFTRQGYNVASYEPFSELGVVEYRFLGAGGVNSAFLTAGFDLIADSNRVNVLTLGVTGSYVFGSFSRNRITSFDSTSSILGYNLYREELHEVSDADVKIGVLYTRRLFWLDGDDRINGHFAIGGFYKPSRSLNTTSREMAYTFLNDYLNPLVIDTLSMSSSAIPTEAPASFGVGAGFMYDERWSLGIDVKLTQWSQLSIAGKNANLRDEMRVSLGVEHIPNPRAAKGYFSKVRYRGGLSYENTRLNVQGQQPRRLGASFGMGMPIPRSRSASIFNLGIEYALRNAGGIPLIENQVNLHFGFTLTPNQFDRWFFKRKYD